MEGTILFVTGGKGFLGSRLLAMLAADNRIVRAPDSNELDITQKHQFEKYDFSKVGTIIHIAGKVFVPDSWENPELYYSVNVMGTQHILDICRKHHIPLIYVSGYVYGANAANPITEKSVPQPNNPYAHSKYLAEELCRFYADYFNVKVTVLRPFNIIGFGQNKNFLLPKIIHQAMYDESIQVFDLQPKRDYVYIDDVVCAIQCALSNIAGFEVYNVGSGISYSVQEVIDIVQAAAETDKPIVCGNIQRNNEIDDVVADISKINNNLGWSSKYSLRDAVKRIIEEERTQ